jgi:hypothetical protein
MFRETSYDSEKIGQYVDQYEPLFTPDQHNVYESVLRTMDNRNGGLIFLDAPGGTGKTFLISLFLAKVRQTGKIALAVAASGIAATLLTQSVDGQLILHSNYHSTWHNVKLQHPT